MPKLIFRYGTMSSSKTMRLLVTAHNYRRRNKKVILIKPKIDSRFGLKLIKSRTGLQGQADIVLGQNDKIDLSQIIDNNIDCVLVDESQFLTPKQVDELREITLYIPVIAYGLRTDYRSKLFPGSQRLMELADNIEEIKTMCTYCTKKSTMNMKHINGKMVKSGDVSPDLGCEDKYLPLCWKCWSGEQPDIQKNRIKNDDFINEKDWMSPLYNEIEKNIYDSKSPTEKLDIPLFTSIEDDDPDIPDGDCLSDCDVTKEQLDDELEEYMSAR